MNHDNEIRYMWFETLYASNDKNLPDALKWLRSASDEGYVPAMHELGAMHCLGAGVKKDPQMAFALFSKAAETHDAVAEGKLGDCYKYGWGVESNLTTAVNWYEKAVEEGNAEAMKELGEIYLNGGDGVDVNKDRGVALITSAADTGEEKAQFMMGTMYVNPEAMGVESIQQDIGKGVEWIKKSAEQGFGMAECTLAAFYMQGIGVEKDLSKAKEYYELALEHGGLIADMEEDAKSMLSQLKGVCATDAAEESDAESECPGLDLDANDEEKAEFQEMLSRAEDGDADAQYDIAVACELGRHGAKRDRGRAAAWYKKSADADKVEAIVGLADCYKDGVVTGKGLEDAIPLYEKAALKGDWRAQHVLALDIYSSGELMGADYKKAIKWALMAADNDGTQYVFELLGKCYEKGLGTDKNIALAMKYYQTAVKKGSYEAQKALSRLSKVSGDCLYDNVKFGPGVSDLDKDACRKVYDEAVEGRPGAEYEMGNVLSQGMYGVVVNNKEAFAWYLKSAEHGFMDAQAVVASYYSNGVKDVVDWNDADKFKWYWEAAMQGHVESMRKVADCFYFGSGVAKEKEEAKRWYIRAAKAGDDDALGRLRDYWDMDDGELRNFYGVIDDLPGGMNIKASDADKERFLNLLKSAKGGDAKAQCELGRAFLFGRNGAQTNEYHGVCWLRKAVLQGNSEAEDLLGDCYKYGWGCEKDTVKSIAWYQRAAEHGNVDAQRELGDMYSEGEHVSKDNKEALKWYLLAAKQGNAVAQYWCGYLLERGEGVVLNMDAAKKWYQLAAENGDKDAKKALERLGD